MVNISIWASGSGSNAENIVHHFQRSEKVKVVSIVTNKSDAFVLNRAKKLNIPSWIFSKDDFTTAEKLVKCLEKDEVDIIILAGFLLKVPKSIIDLYPDRIINIHPALLPKHGGKGMYGDNVHRAVVENKENYSGITIHYVNENYDEGNIIFQAKCEIMPSDSYEDVARKVHELEYKHYPEVIETLCK